jgi:hypothetical protein
MMLEPFEPNSYAEFLKILNTKAPNFLGLVQAFQLTRQWPPLTLSGSSPLERKLLRNLSILEKPHFDILCTDRKKIGKEESIDLTSNSLPG